MKKILLFAVTLACACGPARSQLTLNMGGTYDYQFSSLPLDGVTLLGGPGGVLDVHIRGENFHPGDQLLLEMFEDTPGGSLVFSRTVTTIDSQGALGFAPGAWQDVQGAVRFTMLSGSTTIDSFAVHAYLGDLPSTRYLAEVVPIPEPATTALLGLAAVTGLLWAGHRKCHPNT